MNVHISYKAAKTPDVEKEVNQYIEKLRRRLQVFRPELVHLKGIIEENNARQGTAVSLNLRLPSGQLAAQENGGSAHVALKAAFDDLLEQLTKHKDRLRNQHRWPRKRRVGRLQPKRQVPFEQTVAAIKPETVSISDISAFVNANLYRLMRFIERELRYRENSGQFEPDFISPEEVVDETIAMALGNGEEKPQPLAIEPWLYRLSIRAMDSIIARSQDQGISVPMEQSVRKPNVRASDEPELQFHQPDEMLLTENVIPDRRVATPEQIAASDELITLVEAALLQSPREVREAFILFALEGFNLQEISGILERPQEQVRSAITQAREHLRKALPVPNEFRDKLLQHSRTA